MAELLRRPGYTARTQEIRPGAVKQLLMRTMRRRSQKDRFSWPELERLVSIYWPKPTIRHPWPSQRLTVNTRGRSRMR